MAEDLTRAGYKVYDALEVSEVLHLCEHKDTVTDCGGFLDAAPASGFEATCWMCRTFSVLKRFGVCFVGTDCTPARYSRSRGFGSL
jgi:hypothetical protein